MSDELTALYDAHVDFVWRMLVRLGVPASQVEDGVQEVFLIAHRRRDDFRRASSERTWLGGIAIRVARDARRSLKRSERRRAGLAALPPPHDERGPLEHAQTAQALRIALRLLDELDDEQRAVFVLTEFEGLSSPEIAEMTQAGVNTVTSRLRLARKHFNELAAAYQREEPEPLTVAPPGELE